MAERARQSISLSRVNDGKDAILLMIESSTGNMFKNTAINATLYVTIITGDKTITTASEMRAEFGEGAKLLWGYKPMGETEFTDIPEDDERIGSGGFALTLDSGDVIVKSTFVCNLVY